MTAEHFPSWTLEEAAHLLNRAGFGGSPTQIQELHERGRVGAVEHLLAAFEPEAPAPPAWVGESEEAITTALAERSRLTELSREEREKERRAAQQKRQREARDQNRELLSWWTGRMISSEAPLREKMAFFWHDHFPSSSQKVRRPLYLYQQNELFRREALGNFGRLAQSIVIDPAMMLYLDTTKSSKTKPNENFARELLELFMLGEGVYTEADVKETARALTGHQLNRVTGQVTFNRRQWDSGEKVILGETGNFEASGVVDLLLSRSECGPFIAGKLWEYFVYENPDPDLVRGLGKKFAEGGYEVKPLLREIFLSEEFYSSRAMRSRIKSPIEYVVMLVRQLEMQSIPDRALLVTLQQLGQVPFSPPNVAGWDWGRAWVNTNTLLSRYHFAGFLLGVGEDPQSQAGGGQQGQRRKGFLNANMRRNLEAVDLERIAPRVEREEVETLVETLAFRFFQAPLKEKDRVAFESYAKAKKGVIFTNTEVAELIHLMLSTPGYQLT